MLLSEHVHCVVIPFKMTEQSNKSASSFTLNLNIPLWKLCRLFRKLAGQAMSAVQIKGDTKASKMVENLLKVIHILEGLQQAEHLRMLKVYGLQSTEISN